MKKLLKIFAITLGILIALIAVLIVVALVVIDPNKYRDDIISMVKTHTGRDLKIEGRLGLSVFPWIGLTTEGLELSNAKGFGPEPMARVDSLGIQVELWPLLRKQVVVDAVRLNGLKLNLARAADGRANWDDLAQAKPAAKPAPEPKPEASPASALAVFTVNHVEIKNSEFTWRDAKSGAAYALRGVELKSGDLLGSSPAPLHLAFDLESGKPPVRRRVVLDARVRFDPQSEALDLPELQLKLGDLRLQAKLRGTDVLKAPKLNGSIEVPAFALRPLLKELNVPYQPADAKALGKVALSARLESNAEAISVSDLRLTLDETNLTGKVTVQQKPRAGYRFDLAVDTLDVDRYLPAATSPEKKAESAKAAVVPIALLRDTDADGQLRIQQLKAFGIRSQDMVLKVKARDGRITLGPNQAKLYSGSYTGNMAIDAAASAPRFQFDEKLAGVQLGPLLKDAEVFDKFSGTGNVDLKLVTQGADVPQLKRTLNGTVAVALRDGKIEGVNLQKLISEARALYDRVRGQAVRPAAQASDETAFKSLTANIRVTDGIARNDDLKLEGPVVRAEGKGTANLVQETLDYRLQVTVAEAAGSKGTTVPVHITGTFAKPEYNVDFGALLKEETQQKIEKKLDERLERYRKKLQR